MPKHPDRPYEIIYLGNQGSLLRTYGARAAERGILEAYVAAVKSIQRHLKTDPLEWGDPQNRLRHLRLLLCHGIQSPLHAYYAVDEKRRIVYVQEIKALPGRGLD
ncbi:MAG TPA: hypothetical protein DDY78_11660 [Planctomycetales bacterium]|jgi:hypothetical protein|nr:hypothetical protein [Planctomycetales bacterium]